jgi:outer membrane protein assembly factor BamB
MEKVPRPPEPLDLANAVVLTFGGYSSVAGRSVGDAKRPVFAVKAGGSGDISLKDDAKSNEFIAWFHPQAGPYNPSPIVYGDHYYTLFDRGLLACHDARTDKEIYGKQLFPADASFTASPWAYNSKLFFLSEDGLLLIRRWRLDIATVIGSN